MLEQSYISKIENYSGEKIQYVGETADGDRAVVRTLIVTKQGTAIPVDYRMFPQSDRWRAYDVTLEGEAGQQGAVYSKLDCRRACPREGLGVPLEEAIEEREVAPHDREVAVEDNLAVPQRQRGQELARRARADGRVVLQHGDGVPQRAVAGGDPADPQPRQAVTLGDAAERHGPLVHVARWRQPLGRIMLELPVHLVAEQNEPVIAGEPDDLLEHRPRHQRAGGVVRLVEVEHAGLGADQAREGVEIMSPAVLVAAPPLAHAGAGAARELQRRLIAGRLDDRVIAGPEEGVIEQEDAFLGARGDDHLLGAGALVQ